MHNRCHIDEYQNQHKLLVLTETIPCKFSTIDCEAPENGLTPSRPLPFEGSPGDIKILASSHGLAHGLWKTIDVEDEVDKKKAHTSKAMIFQTLPEDVLMQVAQCPTTKEVWDSIKVLFIGVDLVQKAR
ncbi:hypothetical protein Tco_0414784 [Tanacetum coccineum]